MAKKDQSDGVTADSATPSALITVQAAGPLHEDGVHYNTGDFLTLSEKRVEALGNAVKSASAE